MNIPKTIVVPTDFSELSKVAFPHAHALAKAWGAQMVLAYVVPPESYPMYHVVGVSGFPNLREEVRKSATARLEALAAELGDGVHVSVECCEGRVFEQVEDLALQRGAGLIVVATHGRSGVKRALLGSNAERIVRTSPIPVLSVRAEEERAPLAPSDVKRILVPTDFSEMSRGAFELAQWFASPQTEILVAHVIEPPMYPDGPFGSITLGMGDIEADLRRGASDSMKAWMTELRRVQPTSRETILEGSPADQLIRLAAEERVDLIAISTHGRTGLKHVYLGSVAEKVVRGASCPVLSVREAVAVHST
jgi:nucleotide-binding universal stress UspA family protein